MRTNKIFLVAGNRGTGKTDFIKNTYLNHPFAKKLIVDTFDNPVWSSFATWNYPGHSRFDIKPMPSAEMLSRWNYGAYRLFSSDTDEVMFQINSHVKNALLIFEDATKYIGSVLSKDMRKFLLDSKQKNLDAVLVFHNLASIPPELVRIADFLTLFKTNEGLPSLTKYPFPEIPKMMEQLRNSGNQYDNITIQLN